jgi:hypothetical protein
MPFYDRLFSAMKPIWINKVRKRQDKEGYNAITREIPTMKPLD